jgi:Cft2 family RNA processing exonuclease
MASAGFCGLRRELHDQYSCACFGHANENDPSGHLSESIDMVQCTHLHMDHVGWNTKLGHGK